MQELISKKQAAKYLGITTFTLDQWHRQGRIPYLKLGSRCVRIGQDDLEAFVQRSRELDKEAQRCAS